MSAVLATTAYFSPDALLFFERHRWEMEARTANSHLFRPVTRDIDQWIARIEQGRLPPSIVGHMNWPSKTDRQRIDVVHTDFHQLAQQLIASGTVFTIS